MHHFSVPIFDSTLHPEALTTLTNDEGAHDEYMEGLASYEAKLREQSEARMQGQQNKRKRKASGGAVPVSLTAGSSTGQELRQLQGYLWPLDVYRRINKCAPPKDMPIQTTWFQGRQVRGILLDESHGVPVGSIAIYSTDVRHVSRTGDVLTSDGALDQEQMDRTWKSMQSRAATKGTAVGYCVCVCAWVGLCVCVYMTDDKA